MSAPATHSDPGPWLLGPRLDTLGLLGSVAVSWLLCALWWTGQLSTANLLALWIFGIHGPHFFGTWARTLFDREERAERGSLFAKSWGWFALGPAAVGAALLLGAPEISKTFLFFAAVWAFHHVIKQHFGFVALFRARHRQFDRADLMLTRRYLIFSLWAPIVVMILKSDFWLMQVPFILQAAEQVGVERMLGWRDQLALALEVLFWVAQVLFIGSRIARKRAGKPSTSPQEVALLLACVPLGYVLTHLAIARSAAPLAGDPIAPYAVVPLITIYHNVQYMCLLYVYGRARYTTADAPERYGFAARLHRSLLWFGGAALLYTFGTIGIQQYGIPAFENDTVFGQLLAAFIWGFSFQHYFLDAYIWKVSQDRSLSTALRFTPPAVAAPQPG